jgi:guanylate kinase
MSGDFLLLILSSPSGAGKTTLTKRLREKFPELLFSVSHTTRSPRANEVHGVDYHFTSRPTFEQEVKQGRFLEWAEVHGNLYGTSIAEVERAQATGGCRGIIFDIDYQGARQIKAKRPDIVSVFILPPTMDELERRLRSRASETEDAVQRRFTGAQKEIAHYAFFDYLVINDRLDEAFEQLAGVILAERARRWRQAPRAEALLRTGKV